MSSSLKYFTIVGERCSGTHFLQYAISRNFDLQYVVKTKHFFGHNEVLYGENKDEILYICLMRDPIEWIDSFFKRLHHVPPENRANIDSFIKNEWYSIYESDPKKGHEIMEDRHIITKERYKNIFEMRDVKNKYMLEVIPTKVTNCIYIKYEDLRDDYENTLDKISILFQLKKKNETYEKIAKYKGTYNALYEKKPILLSEEIQEYIRKNVNVKLENEIGYIVCP